MKTIIFCLNVGGLNIKENLVLLTGREHYMAHFLLIKCYEYDKTKKVKMVNSFIAMTMKHKSIEGRAKTITARQYESSKIIVTNLLNKPVSQFTLKGDWIGDFESIVQAQQITGILSIGAFIRGTISHSGGYLWKYKDENYRTPKMEQHFNDKVNGFIKKEPCSTETRKKLSNKMLGSKNPMKSKEGKKNWQKVYCSKWLKPIGQYSRDGFLVKIYDSIKEAKEITKIRWIGDNLAGRRKSSGGFVWKYV